MIVACTIMYAEEPLAVITHLIGDVRVLCAQDSIMQPAVMLADLFDGDSLVVRSGEATVLYVTGAIVLIKDSGAVRITGEPDTARGTGADNILSEDVLFSVSPLFAVPRGSEKIVPKFEVRAPDDTLSPPLTIYVPGNTSLSTARPDVIWSCYPAANWYAVVFRSRGEIVINNATTDTLMPFFEQNEDLTPGSYLICVFAFHDKDTLTSQQCLIRILDSAEVEIVKRKIAALEPIRGDEYTEHLLKALVYEDHALLVRAAQYYEAMSTLDPEDPFPYQTLANLYARLGLPEQANTYIDLYEALKNTGK